jgi:hypothetical protein
MAGRDDVPGVVVGVGSELPDDADGERFRRRTGIDGRTAIYIGRIDENKGCAELFDYWKRYSEITPGGLTLVLIGTPVLPVPDHPRIRHLGFVSDQEKYDALQAAEFLIMPSYFESLSMVALEAWALGKPVLANGRCDVLRGQCIRSNGGLYYESFAEFFETIKAIDFNPSLKLALGRNGRDYFNRHYTWPIIERTYLDMIERLQKESSSRPLEGLPSWYARRRKDKPPADDVVARLPTGPAIEERSARGRTSTARATGGGTVAPPAPAQAAPVEAAPSSRPVAASQPSPPPTTGRPQQGRPRAGSDGRGDGRRGPDRGRRRPPMRGPRRPGQR